MDRATAARNDDLVELVDESGRAIGQAARSTIHHRKTPRHRAFSVYLSDAAGRVLLTRRSLSKITVGNRLSMMCLASKIETRQWKRRRANTTLIRSTPSLRERLKKHGVLVERLPPHRKSEGQRREWVPIKRSDPILSKPLARTSTRRHLHVVTTARNPGKATLHGTTGVSASAP